MDDEECIIRQVSKRRNIEIKGNHLENKKNNFLQNNKPKKTLSNNYLENIHLQNHKLYKYLNY